MTSGLPPRSRLARQCSLAALAAACLLAPATALAGSSPPGGGSLSPRLAQLAKPALRSLARPEQARRLGLAPGGPGSLLRRGQGVVADVRFESGAAAALGSLRGVGAEILHLSRRYQTVTVAAEPAELPAIGELAGVAGVTEVLAPLISGADCGGSVTSEGDTQLNAANARASFGVDGSGVTVGLLSDSFARSASALTHAPEDVAAGDLPGPGSPCGSSTPVGLLDDSGAGADEGRAMAQIVHDLAPGAAIDFATALPSETAFADNIRALHEAGAGVIADDVAYFEEPFFQDGPVAVAVTEVAGAGASYFSAAGNDNVISGGHEVASYEAPFRDASSCPTGVPAPEGTHCMDFDPGGGTDDSFDLTVAPGGELKLDLQWAEPWNGVNTDLDAFLLNGSGGVLATAKNRNVTATQRPFELLRWENDTGVPATVGLAIPRFAGSGEPRLKLVQLGDGLTDVVPTPAQYATSSAGDTFGPTIFGHSGAESAIGVGAVRYDNGAKPEPFSSRGPVKHFFGPVSGTSPAGAIPAEEISKPDVVATDCGVTTFFLPPPPFRFCGTSAATPHAAAVAALLRQANPGASAAQVRADLAETALPVGAFGPDAVGAGLLDAFGAVSALALPPKVTITQAPLPLGRNRRPTIQFTANRPVAFTCSVDGGASQPCASPFTVPANLADGTHGIAVSGVDLAGREGNSGVVSFRIDTRAPQTLIVRHPRKLIRTHRANVRETFRFRSSEAGSRFVCKIDRGLLRFCEARIRHRFGTGKHLLQVRSQDAAGNVDDSPALFHFRVKRIG
jgi:hypothetical protein